MCKIVLDGALALSYYIQVRNILIIVLALLAAFLLFKLTTNPVLPQQPESISVTSQKIQEQSLEKRYEIKAAYPHAQGIPNKQTLSALNKALKKPATIAIKGFQEELSTVDFSLLPTEFSSSLIVEYEVKQATDQFVSVLYSISNFMAGAAHPNNYVNTVNYNVQTNKLLAINDLFKPDSDYLETLSTISNTELTEQYKKEGAGYEDSFIADGVAPKKENFQFFLLGEKGITLVFPPYQVGPYAAGTRMVEIPFAEVSNILNPQLFPKTD